MVFPLDDILLGPAAFGRLHRLDGLILHTGEEPAFTRDYAVSTAIWQRTNPGSYNFRVYDQASDPRGVMLNVPYLEASGGINPASAAWAPGRFPFLERELAKAGKCPVSGCPGPYRNPTLHHLQISFVGRTAQLDAALAPADYLTNALRLIAWADALPNRGPAPLVPSKHGHWQSNRSDCGEWMYSRLTAAPALEDDMPSLTTYALEAITLDVNANVRAAPAGTAPILFRTTALSDAVRVGTITNAEGTWSVFWQGSRKVWAYTVAQNVIKAAPLPLEVVREADCTAAIAAATAPLNERIRRGREAAVQIGDVAKALETVLG